MNRSRLLLSLSFFGTPRPEGGVISDVASEVRCDGMFAGPTLDAGSAIELGRQLGRRHLSILGAESPWCRSTAESRHRRGDLLASPDAVDRQNAQDLAIATLRRVSDVGGQAVCVRVGEVGVAQGAERLSAVRESLEKGESAETSLDELRAEVDRAMPAALDRICRSLHRVLKETEGVRLGLLTGEPVTGLLNPSSLELILEDLADSRLGYWHDPVLALDWERHAVAESGVWLDRHATRMLGLFLHDVQMGFGGLPPGSGEVDFRSLKAYVPQEALRVVRIDGGGGRASLQMAFSHLRDLGFD